MATKAQVREQDEATERLREELHPGDTVHTILRHVSQSGMSREISLVTVKDGNVRDWSWLAAKAMGDRLGNRDGIKVSGCGMDMGFHLVYNLSRTLFPDGFECIGEGEGRHDRCPANDHSNDRNGADYRPDRHHNDGGYALNQRWL